MDMTNKVDEMGETNEITRRELLANAGRGAVAAAVGGLVGACGGVSPRGEADCVGVDVSGVRLGLDTYTIHRSLTAKDPALRRTLDETIAELETLELEGLQIDPSHFPGDDPSSLDHLRRLVEPHGYYVEFGMGGWDVKRLARRIELTARFGGKAVRTFCGDERSTDEDRANYVRWAVPALREAAVHADRHGVDIAIENHGDFTSTELRDLIDQVGHPRIGACLDTGNSLFRKEDPLLCARTLAPVATSMHLKDWTMSFDSGGVPHWKEAVLGEGAIPVAEMLRIALTARPNLYIALETPVRPSDDESETVRREWQHLVRCAAAARRILGQVAQGEKTVS